MARFRRIQNTIFQYSSPQEMYADYKASDIEGLYDRQSSVINSYMEDAYNAKNVAIELPTGGGKTLVGLLIGEFRRRKEGEKIVYCCTNNALAQQVHDHAERYGIATRLFVGAKRDYSAPDIDLYQTAKCIAITSYSALFNSNPFFRDPDIIIFDDAHSAEEYVAANWTCTIRENDPETKELFNNLIDVLRPCISSNTYYKLTYGHQSSAQKSGLTSHTRRSRPTASSNCVRA